MRDKELYTQILDINPSWKVTGVELSVDSGEVKAFIEQSFGTVHQCPKCGVECPGYDRRQRCWRHLDTCQLKTILVDIAERSGTSDQKSMPVSINPSVFLCLLRQLETV